MESAFDLTGPDSTKTVGTMDGRLLGAGEGEGVGIGTGGPNGGGPEV